VYASEASTAAKTLGIAVRVLNASSERDLDEVLASLPKAGISGLAVPAEPFFDSQRDRMVALVARYDIPAIYGLREYVVAGGLMSYGASLPDTYRRAANYVGRVLKGESPANLPVMQPTKYDLVLNMKTAKTLGLSIPEQLLALADEVIE
jgi:putative tryptophan/tyrosine transport system substrate-binding protein